MCVCVGVFSGGGGVCLCVCACVCVCVSVRLSVLARSCEARLLRRAGAQGAWGFATALVCARTTRAGTHPNVPLPRPHQGKEEKGGRETRVCEALVG